MPSDLVERAQRGDHEAFDALASAAYHRLYAIARRILRDGYAAEDAVQDALVRAWRDLWGLRDPGAFDAWLHRLLVRSCADHQRRSRRTRLDVAVAVAGQDLQASGTVIGLPWTVTLVPRAAGDRVTADPTAAEIAGIQVGADALPASVKDALAGIDVSVTGLPQGLAATGAHVVATGVQVTLTGHDVVLPG